MSYKINLLHRKKDKPLDRVIYFALNYLRYILVITQIIVIGVFFYRFKVDQQIIDLQDSINQKKEILQVSQSLIKEAKLVAYKLKQSENIIGDQRLFTGQIDYLLSVFPEKFYLKKMSISLNGISIVGNTSDADSIRLFLTRLKKEAKFKTVNLVNIKKSTDGYDFAFDLSGYNNTTPI